MQKKPLCDVGGLLVYGLISLGRRRRWGKLALLFRRTPVICNLSPKEQPMHLLQIQIQIEGKDPESVEAMKRQAPKIRDAFITLFGDKTSEVMKSPTKREAIRKKFDQNGPKNPRQRRRDSGSQRPFFHQCHY